MTKKSSTKKWLTGHLNDKYVKLANKEGLKSRASYKLKQINERFKIMKAGDTVIDLGAAPGGWSQVAREVVKEKGVVISVDLLPINNISGIEVLLGDVFSDEMLIKINAVLQSRNIHKADVVMSDMAPNLTGITSTDSVRSYELNKRALFYAGNYLKRGGNFVVKLFHNEYFNEYVNEVKKLFCSYSIYKPEASRSKSSEIYLVATNFKL